MYEMTPTNLLVLSVALLIVTAAVVIAVYTRSHQRRTTRDDLDRMWALYNTLPEGSEQKRVQGELIEQAEINRIALERKQRF
ncbi:hypothetical protein ACFVUS_31100 [Nocardia sp. NPDC058058]|uniref:hypothetical protein n=1 Tax=Nocardia sp. NPDC058058 TaxID=3346317 RepID=UPI0036DECB93